MYNAVRRLLIHFLRSVTNISEGEASLKVDSFLKTTTGEALLGFFNEYQTKKIAAEQANEALFEVVDLQSFVDFVTKETSEIPK